MTERPEGTESDMSGQPSATPGPPYPYGPYPGSYPPPPPQAYGGYPPPPPQAYGGYSPPPPQAYGGYPPQPTGPRNGLGIAALVTAIIGLLLVWSVVGGVLLGAAAVILGFIARGRFKRGEATNGGVATSGIVLGFIAVVLSLAFIVVLVTVGGRWFNQIGGGDYVSCMEDAGSDRTAQQQCEDTFQERLEDEFGITPTPAP